MSSAALSSDHVNYLILRYLQEAGHENAAVAFHRDWHRQPQFRDPEDLPFAPAVRRGELVHVIQDGLHHDELTARVRKTNRQFQFTNATVSREALESRERDGTLLENGAGGSRPSSSSAKRKARPHVMRPPDEFPTPAPKRQRRSEGSESLYANGEPMEVDAASPSADADDDNEAASPAVASGDEVFEIPERYDSVAVQTDVKTGPKTTTMFFKIEKPEAMIYHAAFNPDSKAAHHPSLLTVGESLCRFYRVPAPIDDVKQAESLDYPGMPPDSLVTASAWHPQGHTAACAVNSRYELPGGRSRAEQRLVAHNTDARTHVSYLLPPLMEPPGIILLLRYSPDGKYLLVISTNTKRGLAVVYDTSPEATDRGPIAWRCCEHQSLSASWIGDTSFLLCGDHGLVEALTLDQSTMGWEKRFTSETIPLVGLKKLQTSTPDSDSKWDKVAYDGSQNVVALASTVDSRLTFGTLSTSQDGNVAAEFQTNHDLPAQLTAFAFRPHALSDAAQPCLLATAFEDGSCTLYSGAINDKSSFTCAFNLHLREGPALALAWSHDGQYLAISSTELVQIWDIDNLVRLESDSSGPNRWVERLNSLHEPTITWPPDAPTAKASRNGETGHDEESALSEPSLSWNASGEMLAFAVNKQIAVISFRPLLPRKALATSNGRNGVMDMNGHTSP